MTVRVKAEITKELARAREALGCAQLLIDCFGKDANCPCSPPCEITNPNALRCPVCVETYGKEFDLMG